MLATLLKDEECRHCGAEELYVGKKRDGSSLKVYVDCNSCGRDFGCVGRVTEDAGNAADGVDARANELAAKRAGA